MARTKGSYKPGQSGNPKGRKKGTPNKVTSDVREGIRAIVNDNHEQFIENLSKLKPFEFCKIYIDLFPYIAPRLRAVDLSFDLERLTEAELDLIINRLKNSLTDE